MAYVDGSLLQESVSRYFDRIVCVHMCGLLVRSHMNAGQDGFRSTSSQQECGL